MRALVSIAGVWALIACTAGATAITEFPLSQSASLPHHIAKGPDGNMWFTEQTGHRIGRVNATGTIAEFPLPQGGNPIGIAAGPDGNMWFTEAPGNRIGRIDGAGKITEFSSGLSAGGDPGDITAGPDGAMWFVEIDASRIARITTAGTIAEFAVPGSNVSLDNIASDPENIWFTVGFPTYEIGRMNVRTHAFTEFPIPEDGNMPESIARGSDGSMWFALPNNHTIAKINAAGTITKFALPDHNNDPGGPSEITLGPDSNIWFSEFNNSRIGNITPAGTISEFSDGITAGASPDGITTGPDRNIWFTEYNGNRIGKLQIAP